MDYHELVSKVLQNMKKQRDIFNSSSDQEQRKKSYTEFVDGITSLNKILKGGTFGESSKNKIKEILKTSIGQAGEMKANLKSGGGGRSTGLSNNSSANANGRGTNLSNNKSGKNDKEEEKVDNAMSGAIVSEKPNVKWEDVAGLETAKNSLKEAIILPSKFPDIFVGIRKPWKGILLYGPPGTGKTFLAKACATQANSTFFSISSSDLMSKYVGESEKLIKSLFQLAREKQPSIIFIDEIDSLAGARSEGENDSSRRVKTEFMVQMQGVGNANAGNVLVLGATNLPWAIDSAIRRRFEKRIYIALPDFEARLYLIKHQMEKEEHTLTDNDFREIAKECHNFSGSDINGLVKNACYEPLRRFQKAKYFKQVGTNSHGKPVYMSCSPSEPGAQIVNKETLSGDQVQKNKIGVEDFYKALTTSKTSVGDEDLKKYVDWTKDFGVEG